MNALVDAYADSATRAEIGFMRSPYTMQNPSNPENKP